MRASTHPVCCTCLGGNPLQAAIKHAAKSGSRASWMGAMLVEQKHTALGLHCSIPDKLSAFAILEPCCRLLSIDSHATHAHNLLARAAGASITFRDPSGFVMPCSRVENRDSHPAVHFHLAAALRGVWITEALPHTPVSGRAMATTCRQHADVQIDAIQSTARGGESA